MPNNLQVRRLALTILAALAASLISVASQNQPAFKLVTTFHGHTDTVYAVAISPDGKLVATGSLDKSLKLFDAASGKEVRTISGPQGHQKMVLALAFSPDGRTLASGGEDNSLKLWDVSSGKSARQMGHPQSVASVAFHSSGAKLATGAADGRVRIFDVAKGTLLKEIVAHPKQNQSMIYSVVFHPTLDQVASAGFDGTIKLWDAGTGKMVRQFRRFRFFYAKTPGHRDNVYCLAFSPDGKRLASASAGGECLIKIWELADGSVRDLYNPLLKRAAGFEQSHPGWIFGLRYTADGKSLVSAGVAPSNKGYLAVWDAGSSKLLHGEEMPLGAFFALGLMPDGRHAVVGAGPRGKTATDFNKAYLIQIPDLGK